MQKYKTKYGGELEDSFKAKGRFPRCGPGAVKGAAENRPPQAGNNGCTSSPVLSLFRQQSRAAIGTCMGGVALATP